MCQEPASSLDAEMVSSSFPHPDMTTCQKVAHDERKSSETPPFSNVQGAASNSGFSRRYENISLAAGDHFQKLSSSLMNLISPPPTIQHAIVFVLACPAKDLHDQSIHGHILFPFYGLSRCFFSNPIKQMIRHSHGP